MTLGRRIEQRRKSVGISQAELARRVGIRQSTMNSLINGEHRTSRSIVQIARELRTTPAFLMGDTDDPDAGAPALPPSQSALADTLNALRPRDRAALLRLAMSLAARPSPPKEVPLPSPAALTVAFQTYLDHSPGLIGDELARDLAMQLPMILQAAGDGVVSPGSVLGDDDDAHVEVADDEPLPVRREQRS